MRKEKFSIQCVYIIVIHINILLILTQTSISLKIFPKCAFRFRWYKFINFAQKGCSQLLYDLLTLIFVNFSKTEHYQVSKLI